MAPLLEYTTKVLLSLVSTPEFLLQKAGTLTRPCDHLTQLSYDVRPGLSATSWGYNRMDVYGLDEDRNVRHKWWDGYQWSPSVTELESLGGDFLTVPQAVSWGGGRMDLFAVDASTGQLRHKYFDGTRWKPANVDWESLASGDEVTLHPALAVTAWAANRLDVFAVSRGTGTLVHKYWDGSSWGPSDTGLEDLGGDLSSPPAAVSWGANRSDVFAIGPKHDVIHTYWDGSNWAAWESLGSGYGVGFSETPTVVSWGENRLDIFATNHGDDLQHRYWDGSRWSAWESLSNTRLTGPLAVTSWGQNRMDIVAPIEDPKTFVTAYVYKFWDGSQWLPSTTGWYPKAGNFNSAPTVVSWGENRLDMYGIDGDAQLAHQTWYGNGWWPAVDEWEQLGGDLQRGG